MSYIVFGKKEDKIEILFLRRHVGRKSKLSTIQFPLIFLQKTQTGIFIKPTIQRQFFDIYNILFIVSTKKL